MNGLFDATILKNLNLKNRLVMAPMCMFAATDGMVNNFHFVHYASRAVGGSALIIVEATGVLPEGRISDACLGLWKDEQIPGMMQLVGAIHQNGSLAGIQLNHAGRKSRVTAGANLVGPSDVPYQEGDPSPKILSKEDIAQIVDAFRAAAERAKLCHFDFIEIHAAHGFLISQFLSPVVNMRDDEYGQNKGCLLDEVIAAVRSVWPPEKALGIRISAEEYVAEGNHPENLAEIVNHLKHKHAIDIVDVSTGGILPIVPESYPGYQVPAAQFIKEKTNLPVMAGGLISDAVMAEEIIKNNRADYVYLGRELLRNPYAPLQMAKSLGVDVPWPASYEKAK